MTEFSWSHTLSELLGGRDLSEERAAMAMSEIMQGAATPAWVAGFGVVRRAKGETPEEVSGLVKTMRAFAARVPVAGELLDTCGTGGDRAGTFTSSTAVALVCAGAVARVAKHGNRAASSRCGSADVLETLGVRIDLPPEKVASCIEEAGMGFCFAPVFHPAMRHAAAPRRELGVATVFNFLGPLTNPAGVTRQALGVSDLRMLEVMVATLARLGSVHVVAFHGYGGLDELSTAGPSQGVELVSGEIRRTVVDPVELVLEPAPDEAIRGGSAATNAATIRSVLEGERGPRRDIVLLNAAAGLVAAGRAPDLKEGLVGAAGALDSGAAALTLERLIEVSRSL
ncbi:anthranilate phosphoribosyltransferase [soil metagenome]